MNLSFGDDQEAFRSAFVAWLHDNLPWEYGSGLPPRFDDLAEEVRFLREWQRRLADGRWIGVAWPVEYGGRGLGPTEHFISQVELARARAPELIGRIGINLAAPTLLVHGSQAQKARWLHRILTAEDHWCQLFSEPGAGSDLGAISTRAARSADGGYVLNGEKVWTSYAQFADWGVCLARTGGPGHGGISYFAVDMHAPGVEVHPLRQMTGDAEFNEVFLRDVPVTADCLIGEEGRGWSVAASTLSHERGTSPRQLVVHLQLVEELLRLGLANGAFTRWRTRQGLARAYAEVKLFELHNWRTLSKLERGEEPGPEGSSLKLFWSEMSKRLHALAMEVLGD
ncbi:MAG TPA: acyl-CoA dehydrogenase family protein, partial [Acidimicrobiales bacterium]|nr:acyl-CoA dehydrogenase family protein [Acidimicrobiales bacterium]